MASNTGREVGRAKAGTDEIGIYAMLDLDGAEGDWLLPVLFDYQGGDAAFPRSLARPYGEALIAIAGGGAAVAKTSEQKASEITRRTMARTRPVLERLLGSGPRGYDAADAIAEQLGKAVKEALDDAS